MRVEVLKGCPSHRGPIVSWLASIREQLGDLVCRKPPVTVPAADEGAVIGALALDVERPVQRICGWHLQRHHRGVLEGDDLDVRADRWFHAIAAQARESVTDRECVESRGGSKAVLLRQAEEQQTPGGVAEGGERLRNGRRHTTGGGLGLNGGSI